MRESRNFVKTCKTLEAKFQFDLLFHCELSDFIKDLNCTKMELSAARFFTIDRRIIYKHFGSVISYLIVLIQLKN